ncbi:MAG: epoxide hydrolase [Anaerolineae bacterium]|nr:epoxide hydrolase [Anaerolineae bacterium]
MNVQPFSINVSQAVLDDLKRRLAGTRWTPEVEDPNWNYGTNVTYLKKLVDYWHNQYDWRKHETELNKFPHFRAEIEGIGIHFIHVRGKGPNPTPLLLTHGWPDSFYRFHKVIPMLTDPASFGGDPNTSFDVIVPSMPGFGFSDPIALSEERIADLWVKLMNGLGYARFAAAGGDVGANVTKALAFKYPEAVTAIHLTEVGYPTGQEDFSTMSPAELEFAGFIQGWWFQQGAYAMIQMTKPQSLALGLHDSPVGLAAWIMSFMCMTMTGENIEQRFSRDELLTNIMIYWVTETIGSSVRSYYESAQAQPLMNPGDRVEVPTAVAHYPDDAPLPREWAARHVNLQQFTDMARGGHFAAWEVPELYAADLQKFISSLRGS